LAPSRARLGIEAEPDARVHRVPTLPATPVSRFALEKLTDAADSFARACRVEPTSARAHFAAGVAAHELALQRGAAPEASLLLRTAQDFLETALSLSAERADIRLALARVLLERGGRPASEGAPPILKEGILKKPPPLKEGRAADSMRGVLERAAALLRAVVAVEPSNRTARLLLGIALTRVGKPSEARAALAGCEGLLRAAAGGDLASSEELQYIRKAAGSDQARGGANTTKNEGRGAARACSARARALSSLLHVGLVGGSGCSLAVQCAHPLPAALEAIGALAAMHATAGEEEEAEALLRQLTRALPPLLQVSLGAHGYSACYLLLEALYLDAYAGLVAALAGAAAREPGGSGSDSESASGSDSAEPARGRLVPRAASAAPADSPARQSLALQGCTQLFTLVQGRLQHRALAHRIASLAVRLGPLEPRAHFMVGEAILDMPLPGQSTTDAIAALSTAVRLVAGDGALDVAAARAALFALVDAPGPPPAAAAPEEKEEEAAGEEGAAALAPQGDARAQPSPAQEFWMALARAHGEAGSAPLMIEGLYAQAVLLAPAEVDAYLELGRLLECRGAHDDALRVYCAYGRASAAADFNCAVIENASELECTLIILNIPH